MGEEEGREVAEGGARERKGMRGREGSISPAGVEGKLLGRSSSERETKWGEGRKGHLRSVRVLIKENMK